MHLQVHDGGKMASFDGLVLEVSGLSGSATSKRLAIEAIDSVTVAEAGSELMFVVKSRKGGFGLMISIDKKLVWEDLAKAVNSAIALLAQKQGI
ncbi:MAG: hypothetical protein HY817_04920 [Candidatus Abawacabacteria bacterium]|nr:hypothetical protein [Candidatus Abawacabacteria bacterium]